MTTPGVFQTANPPSGRFRVRSFVLPVAGNSPREIEARFKILIPTVRRGGESEIREMKSDNEL